MTVTRNGFPGSSSSLTSPLGVLCFYAGCRAGVVKHRAALDCVVHTNVKWDGSYQIPGEHRGCIGGGDLGAQEFQLLLLRRSEYGVKLWVLLKPGKTQSALLPLPQALLLLGMKEELSYQKATGCSP